MQGYIINGYLIEEEISHGSFAVTYSAVHQATSVRVCIKKISKEDTPPDKFFNEVQVMKKISHPLIVSMIEYFDDMQNYYIVLEKVKGETLLNFINSASDKLPDWILQHIVAQILAATHYLHDKLFICHRDLKLENIMLDNSFNIKLLDFGLSKINEGPDSLMKTSCGSEMYLAPEIIMDKEYTSATDIWAIGCIIYSLSVGKAPFYDKNAEKEYRKICYQDPIFPHGFNKELYDLIMSLLDKDYTKRPTAKEAFESKYFDALKNREDILSYFTENYSWEKKIETNINKTWIMHTMDKFGYSLMEGIECINDYESEEGKITRLLAISEYSYHEKKYPLVSNKGLTELPNRRGSQLLCKPRTKRSAPFIVPLLRTIDLKKKRNSLC